MSTKTCKEKHVNKTCQHKHANKTCQQSCQQNMSTNHVNKICQQNMSTKTNMSKKPCQQTALYGAEPKYGQVNICKI